MSAFIVVIALLGIGVVVVIYGTIARNGWGINIKPVSCPNCGTSLPPIRNPQNVRQALWGGWTCPACKADVDKWGREVATNTKGRDAPETPEPHALKRRVIIWSAVGFLCLTLLFRYTKSEQLGDMLTLRLWVTAIGETALFTALFYITVFIVLNRFFRTSATDSNEAGDAHEKTRDVTK